MLLAVMAHKQWQECNMDFGMLHGRGPKKSKVISFPFRIHSALPPKIEKMGYHCVLHVIRRKC